MIKPFDFADGYFTYDYAVLNMSAPLVKDVYYSVGISLKGGHGHDLAPPDPWFGINSTKDSVAGLDLWNGGKAPSIMDSIPGEVWHFPWKRGMDTSWVHLTKVFRATGGERHLYLGVIQHRNTHDLREITKMKDHARLWMRNDKPKHT